MLLRMASPHAFQVAPVAPSPAKACDCHKWAAGRPSLAQVSTAADQWAQYIDEERNRSDNYAWPVLTILLA